MAVHIARLIPGVIGGAARLLAKVLVAPLALAFESLAFLGATLLIDPASAAGPPSPIVDGPYLFVDALLLDEAKSSALALKAHPPDIRGRVIEPDADWEAMGYHYWSQILELDDGYRLYYRRVPVDDADAAGIYCVAHSLDGLNWDKPPLAGPRFRGQQTNCTENGYQYVFYDPNSKASRPYKKLGQLDDGAFGITGSSNDGLDFDRKQIPLLSFFIDSQNVAIWDDALEKYVFFLRGRIDGARTVVRGEGASLKGLVDVTPEPDNMAAPGRDYPPIQTELPLVFATDAQDWQGWQDPRPGMVDIYHNAAFKYPWARNVYLAFPDIYYHYSSRTTPPAIGLNDGEFEVQFGASRDGATWTRYRRPYVARGEMDGVQMYMVSMGQGMVRRGHDLYQYFIALPRTHGYGANIGGEWRPILEDEDAKAQWMSGERGGVYLAVSQLHRFVSLHAAEAESLATTKPFLFQGGQLTLNFKTEAGGSVCVALLDKAGRELPGFGLAQCDEQQGDEFAQVVSWQGQSDLGAHSGREVRLRFRFRQADIFAFEFVGDAIGEAVWSEQWREDFEHGYGQLTAVTGQDLWRVESGSLVGAFDRNGSINERTRLLAQPLTPGDAFALEFDFRFSANERTPGAGALVGLMGDGAAGRNPLLAVWLDDGGRRWGVLAGADGGTQRFGQASRVGPDLALWPHEGDWLRARLVWNPANSTAVATMTNLSEGWRIGSATAELPGIAFTLDRIGVRMDMPALDPDLALEMDNLRFLRAETPPPGTATPTATPTLTPVPSATSTAIPTATPTLSPSPTFTLTLPPPATLTPTATPAASLFHYLPLLLAS